MNYEDYFEIGTIKKVSFIEKKDIKLFLEYTFKDNQYTSKNIINDHPRWSIISGYYAMHDISKLFLLEEYDIQFTKPSVHDAVIKALKKLIQKKDIIHLIEDADKEFKKIQKLDYFLSKGKEHREKTQYYTMLSFDEKQIQEIAEEFNANIVEPYIKLIKRLLEEK